MFHFYTDMGGYLNISSHSRTANGWGTWIPKNQSTTTHCTMWKYSIALLVEENIIVGLSIHPKLAVAIFLLQKNASNSSLLKLHHCKMSLL